MSKSETGSLASLLVEAEDKISKITDAQVRFERQRLLEGIQRYISERTDLVDKVAVCRCLTETMGLAEEDVGRVRNEFIVSELILQAKLRGYGALLDIASLVELELPKDWLDNSADLLCKRGLFAKSGENQYTATSEAWSNEIQLIKSKAKEVDKQLGRIIQMKGRRDYGDCSIMDV